MLSLGQRIRDLRLKKGITQIELAKGLCTPSMVSQIESDRARPSYKILYGLADRLEVPLEQLLKDVRLDLEHFSQYKLALSLVKAGEYQAAIPMLERLRSANTLPQNTVHKINLELALCYLESGAHETAASLFVTILDEVKSKNDNETTVTVLLHLSELSASKKEYQLAKFHAFDALEKFQKHDLQDPILQTKILTQLAAIHASTGQVQQAAKFYEEALLCSSDFIKLPDKAKAYLNLAKSYHRQQQFEKASLYASLSLSAFNEIKDQTNFHTWQSQLIMLQRNQDNWQQSVTQLLDIASTYLTLGEFERAGEVLVDTSTVYFEHGENEKAASLIEQAKQYLSQTSFANGRLFRLQAGLSNAKGDLADYERYLRNAIQIFRNHKMLSELREATHTLSKWLNKVERSTEAFELMSLYDHLLIEQLSDRGITL